MPNVTHCKKERFKVPQRINLQHLQSNYLEQNPPEADVIATSGKHFEDRNHAFVPQEVRVTVRADVERAGLHGIKKAWVS